jgi:acetylornithine deacetylase/succinyl-diaminopimelate desuccinylase-like protein
MIGKKEVNTTSKINHYKKLTEDINRGKVESLINDLVKIPSPWFEEEEITEFVKHYLEKIHLNPWLHAVSDEKMIKFKGNNAIAAVGNNNGPVILLNAHMDTVKICSGWKRNPFVAQVEGNQ